MRTTIKIDDELFHEVKQLAASRRQTMGALIEDAIRQAVHPPVRSVRRKPIDLPVSKAKPGLCPGVNLDSFASLLDIMESDLDYGGR